MSLWWYLAAMPVGGLGAALRVWATQTGESRVPGGASTMTALVNVLGAFAIGLVAGIGGDPALLLLGAGLLGGFTTFSTWMVEVDARHRGGDLRGAVLLLLAPALLGAAAYAIARVLV